MSVTVYLPSAVTRNINMSHRFGDVSVLLTSHIYAYQQEQQQQSPPASYWRQPAKHNGTEPASQEVVKSLGGNK